MFNGPMLVKQVPKPIIKDIIAVKITLIPAFLSLPKINIIKPIKNATILHSAMIIPKAVKFSFIKIKI